MVEGGRGPAERSSSGEHALGERAIDENAAGEQQPAGRDSSTPPGRRRPTWAADSPGERLLPAERLRRRADYQRCYRQGRRLHGSLISLHFIDSEGSGDPPAGSSGAGDAPDWPRLGITVTRKVGNSVVRHRLKRQVREIYRRWPSRRRLPAKDLIVHLKPAARQADFKALEAELLRLLRRVGDRRQGRRGRAEERGDEK